MRLNKETKLRELFVVALVREATPTRSEDLAGLLFVANRYALGQTGSMISLHCQEIFCYAKFANMEIRNIAIIAHVDVAPQGSLKPLGLSNSATGNLPVPRPPRLSTWPIQKLWK